jgi:hypothetical protein
VSDLPMSLDHLRRFRMFKVDLQARWIVAPLQDRRRAN